MTTMMVVYMRNKLCLNVIYAGVSLFIKFGLFKIFVTDDESEEEEAPLPKKAAPAKPAAKAAPAKPAARAKSEEEEEDDDDDDDDDGVYMGFYASRYLVG